MYELNIVAKGYKFWQRTLFSKCMSMFKWEGLPFSLPSIEIEKRLMQNGFAGIYRHPKYGIVTSDGSLSGISIYNHPTLFIATQPKLGSANFHIHGTEPWEEATPRQALVIYNTFSDSDSDTREGIGEPIGLSEIVNRYSRQLADIDSSLHILTVNTRRTMAMEAKDMAAKLSIDAFLVKIQSGEFAAIENVDADIFDMINFLGGSDKSDLLPQMISARRDIMANFYEEIGIQHKRDKVAEMTAREVGESPQTLAVNVTAMLENREAAAQEINYYFGLDCSVSLREEFSQDNLGDDTNAPLFGRQPNAPNLDVIEGGTTQ